MKKSFPLAGLALASVILALISCSDIASGSERATAAQNKVVVSFGITDAARTIMPTAMDYSDTSKVVLTAEKLNESTGNYEGYNLDGSTAAKTWTALTAVADDSETTQIIKGALYNMTSDTLTLDVGTYNFTLEIYTYTSSTNTSEHLSQTATLEKFEVSASTKTIEFTTSYADNGSLSLTLTWATDSDGASKIGCVEAGLFTLESSGEEAATDTNGKVSYDYEALTLSFDSDAQTCSVLYEQTNVPNGSYLLKIKLFADDDGSTLLNTITDIVKIYGYKTEETIEFDLSKINVLYGVAYNLNGGSWADGSDESAKDTSRNIYTAVALPTQSDVTRSGYTFEGWYTDEDLTKEISEIGTGSNTAQEYTLYAKWKVIPKLYVATDGTSTNDGFTEETALDSITNAVAKIISLSENTDEAVDWTIYIDGEVVGTHEILNSLSTDYAKSLTITGKHANTPPSISSGTLTDGEYTDILNGGSTYSADGSASAVIKGSVLLITSAVPITISNVKITNGIPTGGYGGGIQMGSGQENVTLESGAWITDNHTYCNGGGIMANGTLTMKDGAVISGNSASDWGGGIWIGANASFVMEGGTIIANTAGQGSAVYLSGEFSISGSASIPAGDDASNPQDVFLESGTALAVDSTLSAESPIATISIADYTVGASVLTPADGTTLTSDSIAKFSLVQPEDSTAWYIGTDGTLANKTMPSTKIALYEYDSENGSYTYYLVDDDKVASDVSSLEKNATSNTGSFCFDNDGNFYHLVRADTYAASTIQGTPILLDNGVTISDISLDQILVDQKTNVMYGAKINEMTLELYKYPSLISDSPSVDDAVTYEINFDDPQSFYHSQLAIYGGVLYDVGSVWEGGESTYELAIVTLPESANERISSADKTVDLELSDLGANTLTVTDILYQDGAVYVLLKDSSDQYEPEYYSRGAVLRVNTNTNEVTSLGWSSSDCVPSDAKFYAYYMLGSGAPIYTTENATTRLVTSANQNAPSLYAPSSATSGFYGPSKFIALKPKKLIISDGGIALYTNADGALGYKNINRVVTVDLEKFAISASEEASVTFSTGRDSLLKGSIKTAANTFTGIDGSVYYKEDSETSATPCLATADSGSFFLGIPLSE